MTIVKKVTYVYNGTEYDTEEKAMTAQEKAEGRVYDFLRAGKYKRDVKGQWVIKDEGDVDFGPGARGPRVIGYAEGTYENVVKYAFTLPGFYGYGPGTIDILVFKVV